MKRRMQNAVVQDSWTLKALTRRGTNDALFHERDVALQRKQVALYLVFDIRTHVWTRAV